MKKFIIIIIILSLILICHINEYFDSCKIAKCKPSFISSSDFKKCCAIKPNALTYNNVCDVTCDNTTTVSTDKKNCCPNDVNAISFNSSCYPTCKDNTSYYILNNKCTYCSTKVVKNQTECCTSKLGASTYNEDCTISTYNTANLDTFRVYGKSDYTQMITNISGSGGDIVYYATDRPINSYENSSIYNQYIIYTDSNGNKVRKNENKGTLPGIYNFLAISRLSINFFENTGLKGGNKTNIIKQILIETLKVQEITSHYVESKCIIELPNKMCLNKTDRNGIVETLYKNRTGDIMEIEINTTNNYFTAFILSYDNLNIFTDTGMNSCIKSIDVSRIMDYSNEFRSEKLIKSIEIPPNVTVDMYNNFTPDVSSFIVRLVGSAAYNNLNISVLINEKVYSIKYYKTKQVTNDNTCSINNKKCKIGYCCSDNNICNLSYLTVKDVNGVDVPYCTYNREMYDSFYKYSSIFNKE